MRVIFSLFLMIPLANLPLAASKEEEKVSQQTEDVLPKNFNPGIAPSRQTGYGLVKFEGQDESSTQTKFGLISFDGQTSHSDPPMKFKDHFGTSYTNDQHKLNTGKRDEGSQIVFEGEKEPPNVQSYQNSVQNPGQKKKRRRRRRKLRPTVGALPQPAYNPGLYRPETGYKPPEYTGPLSVLGQMLASVVRNDDAGCVTRMLCEQAAGGALSNSSILTTIAWIITSLPKLQETIATASGSLERFAMAVYYGSASKTQSICKEKYPRCPTDPEDLANYLNSHNFSQYNPNALQNGLANNYGFRPEEPTNIPQYGYLQSAIPQLPYPSGPSSYGFYQKGTRPHKLRSDSVHHETNSHYVPARSKKNNYKQKGYFQTDFKDKDNSIDQIENRIQNNPGNFDANDFINANDVNLKWSFPKEGTNNHDQESNNLRGGRLLRFPDNNVQTVNHLLNNRKTKEATGFSFPGAQSNRQYFDDQILVNGDFGIDNMDFEKVDGIKDLQNQNDEGVEFVYVVRGNGDPNHPEIIKLRPGEKLF